MVSDAFGHPWENHENQGGPLEIAEGRICLEHPVNSGAVGGNGQNFQIKVQKIEFENFNLA